jgi:hypothetical protein
MKLVRSLVASFAALSLAAGCATVAGGVDDDGGVTVVGDGGSSDAGSVFSDGGGVDGGARDDGGPFGDPGVALNVLPPGLGFDCIAPGCRQTKSVRLEGGGPGAARILAVQLDLGSSTDFQLGTSRLPPYDLVQGAFEEIAVTYVPSDATADVGALLVDYGSPSSTVRGRKRIDLVSRVVGTARAEVTPASLSFGYVPVGQVGRLDVTIRNAGTGNALLELHDVSTVSGAPFTVMPGAPPSIVLAALEEKRLTVAYAPTGAGVHTGLLIMQTSDALAPRIEVPLRGTSVEGANALVTPASPIVLGDVRVGQSKTQALELSNQGGLPLLVSSATFGGAGAAYFQVSPDPAMAGAIAPFERVPLSVRYAPTDPGDHDATLTLTTNDPTQANLAIAFTARGIRPVIAVQPPAVSYGRVVLGWQRGPTQVRVSNDGFGPLRIERVYLAPGSSTEITLGTLPGLPMTLNGGNHTDFALTYTAATLSNVMARLVIESDDFAHPSTEVLATGEGVTCAEGCPLANATPRCESGECAIGVCNMGYLNSDGQTANGCECRVENPERSNICADGAYQGTISDDGETKVVGGQLHDKQDVDWFAVYGQDDFQFFSDDFDVRITLSGPAGYRMCVFKEKRSHHENVCPPGGDSPCSGGTTYRDEAGWASPGDDGSDYFIKVYNDGTGPACGTFTLTMRNG